MIKYFVNENKGIVVAKMVDGEHKTIVNEAVDYAVGRICRVFRGNDFDDCKGFIAEDCFLRVAEKFANKWFATPVIGKAKFNFDDARDGESFDMSIGKELAKTRCLIEYYFRLSNMMDDIHNVFSMVCNNLAWRYDMASDSVDKWIGVEEDIMAQICADADQTDIDECNAVKGE